MANKDFKVRHGLNVCGNTSLGGDVAISGNLDVGGNISLESADLSGSLQVSGAASFGSLKVAGLTSLQGGLVVDTSMDVQTTLNADNISSSGQLQVDGTTSLKNTLTVSGLTSLQGGLVVDTSMDVQTTLKADNISSSGQLQVDGTTSLRSSLTVSGDTQLKGNASVGGKIVVGGTTICTSLVESPNLKTQFLQVSGSISSGSLDLAQGLQVSGSASLGSLKVAGTASLQGNADVNGSLTVSGTGDFDTTLQVSGHASLGSLKVDGTTSLDGALTVSGTASFKGDVAISGSLQIGGAGGSGVGIDTSVTLGSTLTVSGATTLCSNLDIGNGRITVSTNTGPHIQLKGYGPNTIRFHDTGSTSTTNALDLVYRATPNTLGFEKASDAANIWETDFDDLKTTFHEAVDISGTICAGSADIAGALQVSGSASLGSLTVTGNSDINGTLTVCGATTLSSTLEVIGNASFDGTLAVTQSISAPGGIHAVGGDIQTTGIISGSQLRFVSSAGQRMTVSNLDSVSGRVGTLSATTLRWTSAGAQRMSVSSATIGSLSVSSITVNQQGNIARRISGTVASTNAGYVTAFTVNGNNLASCVEVFFEGSIANVVVSCYAEIVVNHSGDISIRTHQGQYVPLDIQVISNNNEDFAVLVKRNGGVAGTATLNFNVYPKGDETVTATATNPYSGATFTHTGVEGTKITATGGATHRFETDGPIIGGQTLTVSGLTSLQGGLVVDTSLNVQVTAQMNNISSSGSLTVQGTTTLSGNVQAKGNLSVGGSTILSGAVQAKNTLSVGGTGTIGGTTWANGHLRLGTADAGLAMDLNEIYFSGQGNIGTISGNLALNPAQSIVTSKVFDSTANIQTTAIISGTQIRCTSFAGTTVDITGSLQVSGSASLGSLKVAGTASLQSQVVINSALQLKSELDFTGGTNGKVIDFTLSSSTTAVLRSHDANNQNFHNMLIMHRAGAVELFHNNQSKAATTANGLAITGTLCATQDVKVAGQLRATGAISVDGAGHIANQLQVGQQISVGGQLIVTQSICATGHVIAGDNATGRIGLSLNDGYGNANVTFNHHAGVPDVTGNAARIEVPVDGTTSSHITLEVGSGVQANVALSLQTAATFYANRTQINGTLEALGNATVCGALTVSGTASFRGAVNISGTLSARKYSFEPFGVIPAYSNSSLQTITYNSAESAIELSSESDDTIGMAFPAWKPNVNPGNKWQITMQIRASAATANGIYIRVYEYDAELPNGKIAVSNQVQNALVQEDTRGKAIVPTYENQPASTTWQTLTFEYTPTSTAVWAAVTVLNWTGLGTNALYVREPQILSILDNVNVGSNVQVAGNISASGYGRFGTSLQVSGSASLGSLKVAGATCAQGQLLVNQQFRVTGTTQLKSTLSVAGSSILSGAVQAKNTLSVGGSGTIAGATWANGHLRIGSATAGIAMDPNEIYFAGTGVFGTLSGSLTLNPNDGQILAGSKTMTLQTLDAVNVQGSGTVSAGGALHSDGTLQVSGTASIGALKVAGMTSLQGGVVIDTSFNCQVTLQANTISASGQVIVDQQVQADGSGLFGQTVRAGGPLCGQAQAFITQQTHIGGQTHIVGQTSVGGTLNVIGGSVLSGTVSLRNPNGTTHWNGQAQRRSVVHRNDGSNYFILITGQQTSANISWNTWRPWYVSLSNGESFHRTKMHTNAISSAQSITAAGQLITAAQVSAAGDVRAIGQLRTNAQVSAAGSILAGQTLRAGGNLCGQGNAFISGYLRVTGNTCAQSNLVVNGATQIRGELDFLGPTNKYMDYYLLSSNGTAFSGHIRSLNHQGQAAHTHITWTRGTQVQLMYNNNRKLATTNAGIFVSGIISSTSDIKSQGQLRAAGDISVDGGGHIADQLQVGQQISVAGDIRVGGVVSAGSHIIAGTAAAGKIGLSLNDGYGNANVTFNHHAGVPDVTGNAARIEVPVDATTSSFITLEVGSGVQAGVALSLQTAATFYANRTEITGTLNATTISGTTGDFSSKVEAPTVSVGTVLNHNGTPSYDKIRVWSNGAYAIGMNDAMTHGYLNDYAMTFTMNNQVTRGFVFRHSSMTKAQAAIAFSVSGRTSIAHGLRVGYGVAYQGDPGTNQIHAAGDVYAGGQLRAAQQVCAAGDVRAIGQLRTNAQVCAAGDVRAVGQLRTNAQVSAVGSGLFGGTVRAGSNLCGQGNGFINGTLRVTGATTLSNNLLIQTGGNSNIEVRSSTSGVPYMDFSRVVGGIAQDFGARLILRGDDQFDISGATVRIGQNLQVDGNVQASSTVFGAVGDFTQRVEAATVSVGTVLNHNGQASYDKIRVWNDGQYAIGMTNAMTHGYLNDYAMTFMMSNTAARGFVFRHSGMSKAQAAIAFNVSGRTSIAHGLRVGYGVAYQGDPGTNQIHAAGDVYAGSQLRAASDISVNGAAHIAQGLQVGGAISCGSSASFGGTVRIKDANSLTMWSGTAQRRSVLHRNDGGNYFILITAQGSDANTNWNNWRPWYVSLSNGESFFRTKMHTNAISSAQTITAAGQLITAAQVCAAGDVRAIGQLRTNAQVCAAGTVRAIGQLRTNAQVSAAGGGLFGGTVKAAGNLCGQGNGFINGNFRVTAGVEFRRQNTAHVLYLARSTTCAVSGVYGRFQIARGGRSNDHFIHCWSASSQGEFRVSTDGRVSADAQFGAGGADFAEYFEWADGNTNVSDRIGRSVVITGTSGKIGIATAGQTPFGVVTGIAGYIGDSAALRWKEKYLTDDYGRTIQNEDGSRTINPDWDPDTPYIKRSDRPEWDTIGLVGKIPVRVGETLNPNWMKMRVVTPTVEEYLVR